MVRTLALAMGFVCCATSVADDRNIVKNGGFESAGIAWTYPGDWVLDAAQAHRGERCLSGEVLEPMESWIARQSVALQPGKVYTLRFWARGTQGTKAAAWIGQGDERRQLAQFLRIPVEWRRFEVGFTVDQAGDWELELVFPSSYRATPGRVWVDDVSLTETPTVPVVDVSTAAGVDDFPALAADDSGSLYLAWIETRAGIDSVHVVVAEPDPAGMQIHDGSVLPIDARALKSVSVAGEDSVQVAVAETDPAGMRILHRSVLPIDAEACESVSLAGDADGAWGCLSAEQGEGWNVYCLRLGRQGVEAGFWVTRGDAVNIHPAVTSRGGAPWVVWESNRDGTRQIYAAALTPLAEPVRLSDGSDSAYFPAVASDGAGRIWSAWQQFIDGQYDIVLAEFDGTSWAPARRITTDPYLEARPTLAFTPGGLWLAWETSAFPSARTSYAAWRRVIAARLVGDRLEAPGRGWDALPAWSSNPRLLAGSDGRLHLTVRTSEGLSSNWRTELLSFDGQAWSHRRPLGAQTGRNRPAPLDEAGGRLWVAVQYDNMVRNWNSIEESGGVSSLIAVAAQALDPAPVDPPIALNPLTLPATRFDAQRVRRRMGVDRRRYSIDYGGERLKLFFGQLHEHSEISADARRQDLPPDDNYMFNRDIDGLDFSALTDHDFNLSTHVWAYLGKLARWQNDPRSHVTFLAQEWTSNHDHDTAHHPHGYYGHRNLIIADARYPRWFNSREGMTPADVWDALRADDVNFVQIPHQLADTGNVPTDWDYVDEVAQPVAEIFQHRGSYESAGAPRVARNTAPGHFLVDAWNDGVIIGVIASPDHGGGRGRAAVFAPRLTREAILDGLRDRHSYGTTGANIWLDFRVDGRLMGEKLPLRPGPVRIEAVVSGPGTLLSVEILRDGEVVHARPGDGKQMSFEWVDPRPPVDGTYYYLRVRQWNNEMAWSSPVWFLGDPEALQHRTGHAEPVE